MKDFIISTESTCDLSAEYLQSRGVQVANMFYFVDGETYGGTTGKSMTHKDFYDNMRKGAKTSTSMINEADAEEYFTKLLEQGKDILHIAFAKACSGTYDNLVRVADELNKTHDNKIYVVDSKGESTGEGLIVDLACDYKDNNHDILETMEYVKDVLTRVNLLFTVDNLKYLSAGGRISKSSAIIGNIAKIKPLLYVDDEGKLTVGSKAIGRKISLAKLVSLTKEKFSGESNKIYLSHADCDEDAEYCVQKLRTALPNAQIIKEKIGFVIGSHSGPGTIAIFFLGHNRSF